MSAEEPLAVADAAAAARTPPSIIFALLLFGFAVASPFIGEFDARDAKGDGGWATLRVVLGWLFAGAAAAFVGIICTIVGARRSPRSGWTVFAVCLSVLAGVGFLSLLALSAR